MLMLFTIGLIGSNSPRPVLQFPPPPATPPPTSSPFNIIPPPPSSSPLLLSTPTPLSSPHPSSYGGNSVTPSPFLMNVWVCGGSNYSAVDTLATADQRLLAMHYHQQYSTTTTTTSNVSTSTPTSVDSPPSPPVAGYSRSGRTTSSCVLSTMSKWMHGKCTAVAAVEKSVSPHNNTVAVVVRPDAHAFKQQQASGGGGKNVLSSGGGLAVSGGSGGPTTAAVNCCFSCIHANVIFCFAVFFSLANILLSCGWLKPVLGREIIF